MPINDPIRERKVGPESLAFDPNAQRGGSTVTYQQGLQAAVNNYYTTIGITNENLRDGLLGERPNVWEAERRAKDYTEVYHHTVRWDIADDQTYTFNLWSAVNLCLENIRTMGAVSKTSPYPYANQPNYYHIIPKGHEGDWWYGANIRLKVGGGVPIVTEVHLGIFVNDVLRTEIDADSDNNYGGLPDGIPADALLQGWSPINVEWGDRVDIRVKVVAPESAGDIAFLFPSSVVGYIAGFRLRCGRDTIAPPDNQSGYTF